MDDDNKVTNEVPSRHAVSPSPKSYNFLLRMSKRLGGVATKSFVEVREFLNQEITMTQTERFIAGMPRLKLQKHTHSRQASGGNDGAIEDDRAEEGAIKLDPTKDLRKVIEQSHEVLASANTVFPITLFPDTVFVDRTKITIIRRDFFWSSDTMSIRIEDVLNVSATLGPLFGSLTIASRVMSSIDHFQINHFWRSDAVHLKHIIQGYVIAQHNKIDIAHLSRDELIKTLVEIGHDTNKP